MKRCMYCGHENEDSLVSCSVCGNKLGIAVPTQEPVTPEELAAESASRAAQGGDSTAAGSIDLNESEAGYEAPAGSADGAPSYGVPADNAAGYGAPADNAAGYGAPTGDEAGFGAAGLAGAAAGLAVEAAAQTDDAAAAQADIAAAQADIAAASAETASEAQRTADEAMVTQEPAFAGQIPVNSQFSETTPAGQFNDGENTYAGQGTQYGQNAYAGQGTQYGQNAYAGQGTQYGENAYAGQGTQYGENAYAGQGTQYGDNSYPGPDMTPGYGEDWRQDVGRGQTYGARTQYEARREQRRSQGAQREGVSGGVYTGNNQGARDQYGSAGYGYRQPGGLDPQAQGQRADYGRRESAGGSKMFMVRARKRVKSVTFFLMALAFTAMLALNVYNIYCGNALRNINDLEPQLQNILSGAGTNFFTQLVTDFAQQLTMMIVKMQEIIGQLGKTVELGIAIVFLVPNVLYCLALWLMFFRTDTKRRQFPMGGYTLARVMMILKFLIACLVLAVGLVISVYFVVVSAQKKSGAFDSSLIHGVILLITMIVVSIFVVMYYIQWMFCLKVVRDNAKKGTDPGRMPGFVVFLSILCAALCVLLMIPLAPNDYFGLGARGAAAAYFLISGLWVMIYKIKVKRN